VFWMLQGLVGEQRVNRGQQKLDVRTTKANTGRRPAPTTSPGPRTIASSVLESSPKPKPLNSRN
jgi:hypothetical protein